MYSGQFSDQGLATAGGKCDQQISGTKQVISSDCFDLIIEQMGYAILCKGSQDPLRKPITGKDVDGSWHDCTYMHHPKIYVKRVVYP
jgi:hypothetical protein